MKRVFRRPVPVAVALGLLAAPEPGTAQCLELIPPFDGAFGTGHGSAVAMQGTLAAIGAPSDDSAAHDGGSVYVLDVVSGQRLFKLTATTPQSIDEFGSALVIDQDLLAVGAPPEYGRGGRVFVFDLTTGSQLSELVPSLSPVTYGRALDVDAGRVAAGDYLRGSAYVFDAGTGTELLRLQDPKGQASSRFGVDVALEGGLLAVAVPYRERAPQEKGVVVVFDSWTGQELFVLRPPTVTEEFGSPLAMDAGRIFVGADHSVMVFDRATGAFLFDLSAPDPYFEPELMAVEGDQMIVAESWDGPVLVFHIEKRKVKRTFETDQHLITSVALSEKENRWMFGHWKPYPEAAYLYHMDDDDGDGFLNCEDLGASYCGPAVPNSTGSPAVLVAGGSARVADHDCRLSAQNLPQHVFGFFLASRTQGFVPTPPGTQGNLCLGGSIARLRSQAKSCGKNGKLAIHVPLVAMQVHPGESWNFQAWYRDVNPHSTTNFTDGVQVVFE